MSKLLIKALTLVALLGATIVTGTLSTGVAQARSVHKADAPVASLYKIATVKSSAPPPGCNGTACPSVEQSIPAYAPVEGFVALVGAKKIDTFSTQVPGSSTSVKGGCAITAASKLMCWGNNTYGQLGDGTHTDSLLIPVAAVGIDMITDVSANGLTTCVTTTAGELKCVGQGSFPGFTRKEVNGNQNTSTYTYVTGATNCENNWFAESCYSRVSSNSNTNECQVLSDGVVISKSDNCWTQSSNASPTWTTLKNSGITKVQLAGSSGWSNANICILDITKKVACSKVVPGTRGDYTDNNSSTLYDCDNDGIFERPISCGEERAADPTQNRVALPRLTAGAKVPIWKQRSGNVGSADWTAATWTWPDSGLTEVVDFAMSDQNWGSDGSICMIAGATKTVTCKPFSGVIATGTSGKQTITGGEWGAVNVIPGITQAEKVFITTNNSLGLCIYAAGTLSCGTATYSSTGATFPTEVSSVAVMDYPISVFYSSTVQKVFFMTQSGLLAADQWALNCSNCGGQKSQNILSSVGVFKNSTIDTYFYTNEMTGATDSPDFIPMNVATGTRKVLTQKSITVKSTAGDLLSTANIRWTAPDFPDSLSSSKSSQDVTSTTGTVRLASLATGPVTFTIKGGTLPSGAYLQGSVVTTIIPETGLVEVSVPTPSAVVDRKVSVVLVDAAATPVPNAVITLTNNLLTYSYANSGNTNAQWSAVAPDTKGYMNSAGCSYCYVAPPTYITGADGTVSWKSFAPTSRFTANDATVLYDDGALSQKVKVNFDTTSTTVPMPFMASVASAVPAVVEATSDGAVVVTTETKDGDGLGISDIAIKSEQVCGEMVTGGLWTGTSSTNENYCNQEPGSGSGSGSGSACQDPKGCPGGGGSITDPTGKSCVDPDAKGYCPSSNSGNSTTKKSVTSSGVRSSATCEASNPTTDSAGKASAKLCVTKSGYYRLRSKGVLPSKTFCVKVNGIACTVVLQNSIQGSKPATASPTASPTASKANILFRGKSITLKVVFAGVKINAKAGKVTYKASGACTLKSTKITASKKTGTCTVTLSQANLGKNKGIRKTVKIIIK